MIYDPVSWHFLILVIPVVLIPVFPGKDLLASVPASGALVDFSQGSAGCPGVEIHYQDASNEEENSPKGTEESPEGVFLHPSELDKASKHHLCEHEKNDNIPELVIVSFKEFLESSAIGVSSRKAPEEGSQSYKERDSAEDVN